LRQGFDVNGWGKIGAGNERCDDSLRTRVKALM